MQASIARALSGRGVHYAWVVVGVTFLLLLVAAGVRATPTSSPQSRTRCHAWVMSEVAATLAASSPSAPRTERLMPRLCIRAAANGPMRP
jgi:hypothetical protein